ncbi:MAG: DUF262 domain-containing HNH endonuclease family protein [Vicinamibacterales bacterium]
MQIQPIFLTVGNLLAGRLFRIPQYQRAYSWGSKQRHDLFDDILKVRASGNDASHFMATVVGLRRDKMRIAADEFIELEIVDGQQRLTTLITLLKATSKNLSASIRDEEKIREDLNSLLVKGDDLSLLLLQTNHDSSHIFSNYLRDGTVPDDSSVLTAADKNLLDAIRECETFVARWREDGDLISLVALIRNQLSLIFHEIEDEGLVYTVFEVLNSRGLDVTWFDKLKTFLMAIVFETGEPDVRGATLNELHNIWREIYRTIGLRQNLNKETLRFAGTLRAKNIPSRPLAEEAAADELTEWTGRTSKGVVRCSHWILDVTKAEDKLLSQWRLRAPTHIVQARLAAIAILLRQFPSNVERKILNEWEKVTFRIYGLMGNDARTAVGDYVRLAWRITNEDLPPDQIAAALSRLGQQYPIEEAVAELVNSDCYNSWTEELRYFMFRYEESLAVAAGQKINESQWNKIWRDEPAKSIEHIRPRSRGSDDPKTSAVYVHRLGNLTMLPPGVNSKLQDDDPLDKRETYLSCGLLGTIEVAKMLSSGKWNRSAVETREKKLIEWARKEWS